MPKPIDIANKLARVWIDTAIDIADTGAPCPGTVARIRELESELRDAGVTPIRIRGLVAAARERYEHIKGCTNQWGRLVMDEDDRYEDNKLRTRMLALAREYEIAPIEVPDLQPGQYVVTIMRGDRIGYLLGPYGTHQEAIDNKPRARDLAHNADPWSDFDAIGTVRFAPDAKNLPPTVFGK